MERYVRGFASIRKVQKYVKSQALAHGVPIIPNYSLDQALAAVIDLVVEKANEAIRSGAGRKPTRRSAGMEAVKR
jgi:2-phosphoglycerate kinase